MTTATYRASLYTELRTESVDVLNGLAPDEIAAVSQYLRSTIFAGVGRPPSGAPWEGRIDVDSESGAPIMANVHALANTLVADWNSKYDLQFLTGTAGSSSGSQPLNNTWRWVWTGEYWARVPNYGLVLAPSGVDVFDPLTGFPNNPGLLGRLRLEIRIDGH